MNGQQFNKELVTRSILTQKWPSQSNTIYYVGLYKQSQSGLLFNQRMLIIQDKTYTLFYTKYFKPLPLLLELEKKGGLPIKERTFLVDAAVVLEQNIIHVKYLNADRQKKSWIFKFITNELASKWVCLFSSLQEQYINKQFKTKHTKSTQVVSEFNSNVSKSKSIELPYQQVKEQFQQGKKEEKHIFY